jgi:hypothetical protein
VPSYFKLYRRLIPNDRSLKQRWLSGLKEALKIGTDSAAARLAQKNGYYGDQAVKILLPPEAAVIVNNVHRLPGGEKMLEDLILRINRSAEDAARESGPVFYRAITQMSIQDGFTILRGEQDAATSYLRNNTYSNFSSCISPN